jgi:hypothetical protein
MAIRLSFVLNDKQGTISTCMGRQPYLRKTPDPLAKLCHGQARGPGQFGKKKNSRVDLFGLFFGEYEPSQYAGPDSPMTTIDFPTASNGLFVL